MLKTQFYWELGQELLSKTKAIAELIVHMCMFTDDLFENYPHVDLFARSITEDKEETEDKKKDMIYRDQHKRLVAITSDLVMQRFSSFYLHYHQYYENGGNKTDKWLR